MFRRLRENFSTLAFAFVLALIVWAASINQNDPTVERTLEEPIAIQYVDLPQGLLLVGDPPEVAAVTLRAPQSILDQFAAQDIILSVNLGGKSADTHRLPVEYSLTLQPVQVTSLDPEFVTITLEPSSTKEFDIQIATVGQPALGFEGEEPRLDVVRAVVVGPRSSVEQVVGVRASINLTNRQESLEQLVTLEPINRDGLPVFGVEVTPVSARVTVSIHLQVNYRLVSVIPIIEGQAELEEAGYRVTEFSVTPSLVTIYSSDPLAFAELPGFVETVPLSLIGVTDDIERRLPLNLPAGFSPVGDASVTVKVSIEPRLNSITITRKVGVQGLGPGLYASPSPETVNLILTGPAATLDNLKEDEILIFLDLLDLALGTYQITPQVVGLPSGVSAGDPIPGTVQVTITNTPPPTPTPDPGS